MSENKDLYAALAKAQQSYLAVKKNKKGHNGKFADLASCILATKEAFADNDLCFSQLEDFTEGGNPFIRTRLMHKSGGEIESRALVRIDPNGRMNESQKLGAALTYARRYSFCAVAGLAADDDDADYYEAESKVKAISEKNETICPEVAQNVKDWSSKNGITDADMSSMLNAVECESVEALTGEKLASVKSMMQAKIAERNK